MNTKLKSILVQRLAKNGKKLNGFTLIELMVVVAIVGILSGVGLPQLLKAQDNAKDSVAKQEAVSAAKECSIYLLNDSIGDEPDGAEFETVSVTAGCAEVVATSTSDDAPTFTVTLTGGIPGKPVDSRG